VSIGPEPGARWVWLVPGSYPLRYEGALCIDHSGGAWPQGSLDLDALDASTETRTIDIPAVDGRFVITWGGGPLPTTHTVHAVPLALVLTLPGSPPPGAVEFAAMAWVDLYTRAGALIPSPTVRVIPGAYDVWLAVESNEETFVGGAVAQSLVLGAAAVSIDLPRAVDVTGIVTLDGAPLPAVGMNGYATSVVARSVDPRLATAVTLTWPHAHPAFVSRINPGTYAPVLSTGGEAIDGPFPAIDAQLGCWIVPSP
jgi:hypothetical protein